jgi:hypothetical protein
MKKIEFTGIEDSLSFCTSNSTIKSLEDTECSSSDDNFNVSSSSSDTESYDEDSDSSCSNRYNPCNNLLGYDSSDLYVEPEWRPLSQDQPVGLYENESETFGHGNTDFDDPFNLFKFFFTAELLNLIVKETNFYAFEKLS